MKAQVERWRRLVERVVAESNSPVPPSFVLALIEGESGGNPKALNPRSGATGLLQITKSPIEGYNLRYQTGYGRQDMLEPEKNVRVGVWHLTQVVRGFEKNHPHSLSPDFTDPRYCALLAAAWNVGHSEKAGLGKIVGALEKAGVEKERITVAAVFEAAPRIAGATRLFSDTERAVWASNVTRKYFGQEEPAPKGASKSPGGWKGLLPYAAVGGVAAFLLWRSAKRSARDTGPALEPSGGIAHHGAAGTPLVYVMAPGR